MKQRFTLKTVLVLLMFSASANLAMAQNDVYWREGFEGGTISTTNPTATPPGPVGYHATGANSPGTWYMYGTYRTTGQACTAPHTASHIRFRNGGVALPDSPALVTPIVNNGIREIHFTRTRSNGGFNFYITTDTSATTTNWTFVSYMASATTCVDEFVDVTANPATAALAPTARRVKIVSRQNADNDIDSIWLTSFSTLPVSFATAKAFQKNSGVSVDWTAATEVNVSRYLIEKSIDGTNFREAGSVVATGNGTSAKNYSWFDATPNMGNNFYRIKAVDRDGSFKTTSILKVTLGKGAASLMITPNPVRGGILNLQMNNLDKGTYNVQLLNGAGQKVFGSQLVHLGGSASEVLQIPSLQKGLYNLQLLSGTTRITKSVVIE